MEKQWKPVPDVECLKYHGTPEKPDVKIFVSHRIDLDSETVDNPIYIPVRCGAVFDKREGITMLGDDTGDNISEKRNSFCELTVQYWAWKNVEADYYGLCHYRRYLSFASEIYPGNILAFDNLADCANKFSLENQTTIQNLVQQYDFITGIPYNFHQPRYKQYAEFPGLNGKDLVLAANITKKLYPDFSDTVDTCLNGNLSHICNIFIIRSELFHEYCSWLFSILFELELRIDISNYSIDGQRSIAYISEQLMDIYFTYIKNHCPQYKTFELQLGMINNTVTINTLKPAFATNNIPVVFACSDYYIPYAAATFQSLIEHANNQYNYDLVILHTGVTDNRQSLVTSMINGFSNISLRFFNVERFIKSRKLLVHDQYSVETFYRLLIPQIFCEYEKVIYLDCDLTILHDISELFKINIDHFLLAATVDASQINLRRIDPKVYDYHVHTLGLKNPDLYFQAGVLLMNIGEFNKAFQPNELLSFSEQKRYMFVDQDVLNAKCEGRVRFVDMKWDVLTDYWGLAASLRLVSLKTYNEYLEARKTPYIIHHASKDKPWQSPQFEFAEMYWEYERKTPFYEVALWRMINQHQQTAKMDTRSGARKFADKLLPKGTRRREFAKWLLPKDSLRWQFCKWVYSVIRPQHTPD